MATRGAFARRGARRRYLRRVGLGDTPGAQFVAWTDGAAGTGGSGENNIPVWANVTPPVALTDAELGMLYVNTDDDGYPVFWAPPALDPDPLLIQGVYDANITAMDPVVLDDLQQAAAGNTAPIEALTNAVNAPGYVSQSSYQVGEDGDLLTQIGGAGGPSLYLVQGLAFDDAGNLYNTTTGQPTGAVLSPAELETLLATAQLPAGDTGPGAQAEAAYQTSLTPSPPPQSSAGVPPTIGPGATEQGFNSALGTLVYLATVGQVIYFDLEGNVFTSDGNPTGQTLTPAQVTALVNAGQLPAGTSIAPALSSTVTTTQGAGASTVATSTSAGFSVSPLLALAVVGGAWFLTRRRS